jgi:hypothetical protein
MNALNLLKRRFDEENKRPFHHVLIYFLYILEWSVLRKTDEVAIKCPLSLVTANFFMDACEYGTLNTTTQKYE